MRNRIQGTTTVHTPPIQSQYLLGADEMLISSRDAKPSKYPLYMELCVVAVVIGAVWVMM